MKAFPYQCLIVLIQFRSISVQLTVGGITFKRHCSIW